jgi:hypothetical protein
VRAAPAGLRSSRVSRTATTGIGSRRALLPRASAARVTPAPRSIRESLPSPDPRPTSGRRPDPWCSSE